MLIWLIFVAALALVWASMWKGQLKMALGILIGLPIGWLFADFVQSYLITDMHEIPLWLPPLPFAIAATLLIVVGAIITFRGDDDSSKPPASDENEH